MFRLCVLIVTICITQIDADFDTNEWLILPDFLTVNNNTQQILETIQEFSPYFSNLECLKQLSLIGNSTRNLEEWALKFFDSWAKPQSGILSGNMLHVGNYDECLAVNKKISKYTRIQGKYCTAFFEAHPVYGSEVKKWIDSFMKDVLDERTQDLPDQARLSFGFCVPKVCDETTLQNLTDILENQLKSSLHFKFFEQYCSSADPRPFTAGTIITILIFSIFAIVIVVATLYDGLKFRKLPEIERRPNILIAFSALTNCEKIFSTRTTSDSIHCLNGLRVMSMMWVVVAHVYQYAFFIPHINSLDIFNVWKKDTKNAFILGSSMSVDTFFVVSGLLVTYLFLKNMAKGTKFNLVMFYVHRILRLSPAIIFLLLFTTFLINYLGDGPFWPILDDQFVKQCRTNWWSTLLYVQNYVNYDAMCLGQTWYLAVDTHLYFLSPLVLFPLLKWPKVTIGAVITTILASLVYIFVVTWTYKLGSVFINESDTYYRLIYFSTHARASSYLVGMICGYYLYKRKGNPLKLNKKVVLGLWTVSLAVLFLIVLGHSWILNAKYNVFTAALFNSTIRTAWSLAVCVIIILCVNNYGSVINSFLSSGVFTILIRLNYCLYLVHMNIMIIIVASGRTPTYFSNLSSSHYFWGDYMFCLAVALMWTLAFESPILTIEKIVFGNNRKKDIAKNNKDINNKSTVVQLPKHATSHVYN